MREFGDKRESMLRGIHDGLMFSIQHIDTDEKLCKFLSIYYKKYKKNDKEFIYKSDEEYIVFLFKLLSTYVNNTKISMNQALDMTHTTTDADREMTKIARGITFRYPEINFATYIKDVISRTKWKMTEKVNILTIHNLENPRFIET